VARPWVPWKKIQEFSSVLFDTMAEESGDAPGGINVAEYFSQMGLNKNVIKR